jgi:hypothetical protein
VAAAAVVVEYFHKYHQCTLNHYPYKHLLKNYIALELFQYSLKKFQTYQRHNRHPQKQGLQLVYNQLAA